MWIKLKKVHPLTTDRLAILITWLNFQLVQNQTPLRSLKRRSKNFFYYRAGPVISLQVI